MCGCNLLESTWLRAAGGQERLCPAGLVLTRVSMLHSDRCVCLYLQTCADICRISGRAPPAGCRTARLASVHFGAICGHTRSLQHGHMQQHTHCATLAKKTPLCFHQPHQQESKRSGAHTALRALMDVHRGRDAPEISFLHHCLFSSRCSMTDSASLIKHSSCQLHHTGSLRSFLCRCQSVQGVTAPEKKKIFCLIKFRTYRLGGRLSSNSSKSEIYFLQNKGRVVFH